MTAQAHYVMGTILQVQLPDDIPHQEELFAALFKLAHDYDALFSTYQPNSPVSKFNASNSNSHPQQLPGEVYKLTHMAKEFSLKTRGAFDITVGPLIECWRKAGESHHWPTKVELSTAISRTGISQLELSQQSLSFIPHVDGMSLDYGGIAKGYCVDKMAEQLLAAQVKDAFINFGESSIMALGQSPDGSKWQIDVRAPGSKNSFALTLAISDMALGSSASYEHFYQIGKRKVSHIFNPLTGKPVSMDRAVTVVAINGTEADVLSTALMVLPIDEGFAILDNFPGAEAVIFFRDSSGHWQHRLSKGMGKYIIKVSK